MALDYSDKGKSDSDTVSNHLYAVGWNYEGDRDGDGKDDGSNALFQINFYSNGYISLEKIADITGSDGEILTLGCTTEGQLYGISTAGKLYSLERDGVCTYIGTTDFVNYANYSAAMSSSPWAMITTPTRCTGMHTARRLQATPTSMSA